jgi:hypothetical protein
MHRLQRAGVLERQPGHARGDGQGGEEGGDEQGAQRHQQTPEEPHPASSPPRGIVENQVVHRPSGSEIFRGDSVRAERDGSWLQLQPD